MMAQACNPGTLEVVAKEPTFKVILCYTLSSEPAWTNETVSKKKKKHWLVIQRRQMWLKSFPLIIIQQVNESQKKSLMLCVRQCQPL
ncbi:similar to RIKEN cDNA 2010305C02 (predicted), isoform CRA_b [Rattus norvegicus]|uniref:Uncharacterized protein n=1 Tax=Rattus norvegicus TaxID=10116 RepID=A6HGR1_RAT|nr:similar to RIKEN cDNA 2010305C02 (predicted), isoform CRA_b [Rattus norvegicus]EDM05217.1 similar to RIKEN cDNA 2010305C02 (predicted), isoform CRA_b [Rattus norvegicus]